jgi:hypothetical protein
MLEVPSYESCITKYIWAFDIGDEVICGVHFTLRDVWYAQRTLLHHSLSPTDKAGQTLRAEYYLSALFQLVKS